ncbi:NAD(P)-binding protein [Viridothelium virens]|uniref:NAD(P)-binding protein n=1 Tax=Viridothelium virens TaxID=1048519 RepID=A0A6A6HRT6_VIRVR|nr:NAD(P)-binding protein [Viridothelium virens]
MAIPFAVIAGVGPGTGAAVSRKFATSYPVALLARNPDNYESLVKEINGSGGKAIGISTDVTNAQSIKSAITQISKEFGDAGCAAAIFNASAGFSRKPFLDLTEEEFVAGYNVSSKGAFLFTQATLPLLLKGEPTSKYPPTIIYTGATASIKGSAQLSSFAHGKWALRAMSQSVAREFAPKGIHVAHAIIDGVIDIPRTKEWLKDQPPEAKISPDGIADAYWHLHTQPKTTFTNEIDIRPMLEKW